MNLIEIVKVDGTIEKVTTEQQPTLKEVQDWVGGYVERVSAFPMDGLKRDFVELYVNEEGRLDGLPVNEQASVLCGQEIVGNAVIFKNFKWE